MANLPPCAACSYTIGTETLFVSIATSFQGTLRAGYLMLRTDSGNTVVHNITTPASMTAGQTATVPGMTRPAGNLISAVLGWTVIGDPNNVTNTAEPIPIV